MTEAALPRPLPPDWTYEQARAHEAVVLAHVDAHGPSPEAASRLFATMAARCAYGAGTAIMNDALCRWPDMRHPALGLNARLGLIQCAIHGGSHDVAARCVREIADDPAMVFAETAESIAALFRGTGLQPEAHRVLKLCLEYLDAGSPMAEAARVLVNEYAEVAALAAEVSLTTIGLGCYGWLQPNRYMLRHVNAVSQSMPFNMLVSIEAGVTTILEDSFAGFADASEYQMTRIIRGIPVARHRRYALMFNHDCDDAMLAGDMAPLRELYVAKATAFRRHATSGKRVFLYNVNDFGSVPRLERALAGLMQDEDYRLLVVASASGTIERPQTVLPTTRMVHLPLPAPGYNWTLEDKTPAGVRYDLDMRRAIIDAMRSLT